MRNSEKRYATIENEALAIVYGVKRFHEYLCGCPFILKTDHKLLQHILGTTRDMNKITNVRIVRRGMILSEYTYSIEYIEGKNNVVADALSKLPPNEILKNGDKVHATRHAQVERMDRLEIIQKH